MEAASRQAFTLEEKQRIFAAMGFDEAQWQDLGGFESFVFADEGSVFRVTHESHRTLNDINGELEFVEYLHQAGAAVCRPLVIPGQQALAVKSGAFVLSLFEKARGQIITEADWQPALFRAWGTAIGQFHRLASHYQPQGARRFDWRTDANLDIRSRVPASHEPILQHADQHLARLHALPIDPDVYGLIHSDAHAGNFFLAGKQLTFFDFDDCCYQWYAFDVATIVFSAVLQPWIATDQRARLKAAHDFLPDFFEGYEQAFAVSDFLLKHLPLFLKLRELSLYGVMHSHFDIHHLTDWYPVKFMEGREARLEADLPYLEMDFMSL